LIGRNSVRYCGVSCSDLGLAVGLVHLRYFPSAAASRPVCCVQKVTRYRTQEFGAAGRQINLPRYERAIAIRIGAPPSPTSHHKFLFLYLSITSI
jgi:hypothetical protein